jgi:hypothetical protein
MTGAAVSHASSGVLRLWTPPMLCRAPKSSDNVRARPSLWRGSPSTDDALPEADKAADVRAADGRLFAAVAALIVLPANPRRSFGRPPVCYSVRIRKA